MLQISPEMKVFKNYLESKRLKKTTHRMVILQNFIENEGHRSIEDIYGNIKLQDLRIGYSTVYRTMKLLTDAGLAREVDLGDGMILESNVCIRKSWNCSITNLRKC